MLYHVNVRSPELSVARVACRVRRGGHDVPEAKIRERYDRNQQLIRLAVLGADRAFVYDNSIIGRPPRLLVELRGGCVCRRAERIAAWAGKLYARELQSSRDEG